MKVLENQVVRLIPIARDHVDGIFEAAQDQRIWEHMAVHLKTREDAITYVEDALKKRNEGNESALVIYSQADQKIIGATWFLDIAPEHKRTEIGSTWLNPDYWRTSINTNCKFLLLTYCFEDWGLNRVQIKTGHQNIRSQKAIERIGAKKEGILRNHMIRKEGDIRHTVMYSIIREEWPDVKKHFIENLLAP